MDHYEWLSGVVSGRTSALSKRTFFSQPLARGGTDLMARRKWLSRDVLLCEVWDYDASAQTSVG